MGHDGRENMLEAIESARPLIFNQLAAERRREAATLLAHQDDNPLRVAAYRQAADVVTAIDADLRDLATAAVDILAAGSEARELTHPRRAATPLTWSSISSSRVP